ncbi:hypothetical protein GQ53DRAFT_838856 [Thozetella sp. PMI_491]|nr:hypothetical protein GQ53DRAFT_838856 [Thozetella sp. PMI_491]
MGSADIGRIEASPAFSGLTSSHVWRTAGGRALQAAQADLLAGNELRAIHPRRLKFVIRRSGLSDRRSVLSSGSPYASNVSSKSKVGRISSRTSSKLSHESSVFSAPARRNKKIAGVESPIAIIPAFNYWCTSCDQGFKSKQAWKWHEEKRHHNPNRLMCPKPDCSQIFWDVNSFRQHLQFSSHHANYPDSETEVQNLGRGKRWACGFCAAVHTSHADYLEHVAWHYAHGSTFADWSHTCVIRGLLLQPIVYDAWISQCDRWRISRNDWCRQLLWDRDITGRTELFAFYDRPGQLQDRLEHFCGSLEDAQDLVDIAIAQAMHLRLLTDDDATPKLTARHLRPADIRQCYLERPLPPLPSNRPPTARSRSPPELEIDLARTSTATTTPRTQRSHSTCTSQAALTWEPDQKTGDMPHGEREGPQKLLPDESKDMNGEDLERPSDSDKILGHSVRMEGPPLTGVSEDEASHYELPQPTYSHNSFDADSAFEGGSHSDGETSSSLSYESDELADALQESLTAQALSRSLQATVNRVMEEFWIMWHHEWDGTVRQHAGNSAEPTNHGRPSQGRRESGTSIGSSSISGRRSRRQSNDDSGDGDAERNSKRPSQTPTSSITIPDRQKFSCPFRKHDPITYSLSSYRVCAASSWDNTSRLKEHIYRCHRHLYCPRCKVIFENKPQLDLHVEASREDICDVRPGRPPGITPEQERQLRSKKRPAGGRSEEEKWRNIYALLFPNEDIPSCYFEPIEEAGRMSPEAHALEECEGYIRRQVPRLVRSNLIEVARQDMQPIEERLLARLHQITQDSIELAFRQFRESHAEEPHVQNTPSGISAAYDAADFDTTETAPTVQTSSTQLNLDFLDNLFGPLPVEEVGFDDVDISEFLEPSPATEFSDSGYASGQPFCDTPSI